MRCATSSCKYETHTKVKNNGGLYCCLGCKNNNRHGVACQKKKVSSDNIYKPKFKLHSKLEALDISIPNAPNRSWFYLTEIASIYGFPTPSPTGPSLVVGVLSFGGGLYGTLTNGVLTNGDVQTLWGAMGISSINFPKIIIVPVNGATNNPNVNDGGSTFENTLDVQTIGGCYPTSNLTIILYLGTPSSTFTSLLTKALNPVTVNSVSYKPTIISCSWGLPEIYVSSSDLTNANNLLQTATTSTPGITVCAATGDYGSNDGVGGSSKNVDFPSCSPYVTAVGGTSLICTSTTYSTAPTTVENAWSSGGGGISTKFIKPTYQSAITATGRSTPDISSNADPNTGVLYYINGSYYVFGGTSVAAPTVASFFAANNLKTFANTILYKSPTNCFHDITSGSNGAYTCKVGYDNCTGFGSINGANLITALTSNTYTVNSLVSPIAQGSTFTLLPNPLPTTAITFIWSSSNINIATVDNNGIVTAVSPGSVTISCGVSGGVVTATYSLNIIARTAVTAIAISPSGPVTISRTSTQQLTASVSPVGATNKALIWTTSDGTKATVNASGKVTGVTTGIVTITCTSVDNTNIHSAVTINLS